MVNQNRALIPGIYLSDKDLAGILSVSRGHIWEMVKNSDLPAPIKLSMKTTRWKSDSIIEKLNQTT